MAGQSLMALLWGYGSQRLVHAERLTRVGKREAITPGEVRGTLDAIVHPEVSDAWHTLDDQMTRGVNEAVYGTNPKRSTAYFVASAIPALASPHETLLFGDDQYPHGFFNLFVMAVQAVHQNYKPASASIGEIRFERAEKPVAELSPSGVST